MRAGAVLLDAIQAPAPAGPASGQPGAGRLRGPDPPAAASGRRCPVAELSQDGQRVGMTFGQPRQRKIFTGQVGQDRPALPGPPAAGQRQVQPARLDRFRERRGDRRTGPAGRPAGSGVRLPGGQVNDSVHRSPLVLNLLPRTAPRKHGRAGPVTPRPFGINKDFAEWPTMNCAQLLNIGRACSLAWLPGAHAIGANSALPASCGRPPVRPNSGGASQPKMVRTGRRTSMTRYQRPIHPGNRACRTRTMGRSTERQTPEPPGARGTGGTSSDVS